MQMWAALASVGQYGDNLGECNGGVRESWLAGWDSVGNSGAV